MFFVSAFATVAYLYAALHDHPIYEYHNVKVVRVIDPYKWQLQKADGQFVVSFCRDYPLEAYDPQPGLVMNKLRYEDTGICASVRRSDCGFWWKRDINGIAVKEN